MKKVLIAIDDLMEVLEVMREAGTREVIFFTHKDLPALADAAEPENIIMFQPVDEDSGAIH